MLSECLIGSDTRLVTSNRLQLKGLKPYDSFASIRLPSHAKNETNVTKERQDTCDRNEGLLCMCVCLTLVQGCLPGHDTYTHNEVYILSSVFLCWLGLQRLFAVRWDAEAWKDLTRFAQLSVYVMQ